MQGTLSSFKLILFCAAFLSCLGSFAFAQSNAGSAPALKNAPKAPTKAELLARLKEIQSRQSGELQTLDEAIKKRFVESTTLTLKSGDSKLADRKIVRLGGAIEDLAQRRLEYSARRDFLSNLIFTFDTKWTGQPVGEFLEHTFLDMAMTDISDSKDATRLWEFLVYSSIAVREVPEPREDALNVFESYMNFATVLDPKTPALFLSSRSYTNGNLSYSAKPVPRDQVGDLLEKQLKTLAADTERIDKANAKSVAPADIEIRIQPITAPPAPEPEAALSGTVSGAPTSADANVINAPPAPSPTPRKGLPRNIPAVNPTNGAAVPPAPPAVPGENH